ncbi:MAG: PAS domain S-box protein, partial [Bacteroidota bacterium]
LILHSYHPSFHWNYEMTQGIKSVFDDQLADYHLAEEYMDSKRLFDKTHQQKLLELYRHKYSGVLFDLIIATDDDALRFLVQYGDTLFPGTPVVFCGVNNFPGELRMQKSHFTGVLENIDITKTVSIALELVPETRKIYFAGDLSTTSYDLSAIFRKNHEEDFPEIDFHYIHAPTLNEMGNRISLLPPDGMVMLWPYLSQENHRLVDVEFATKFISESSPVPVFGFWQFMLDHGIVGGKLVSGRTQGENAARLAIRILLGEQASEIAWEESVPNEYFFDYEQLVRFNIAEENLPKNSILINKPKNFFQQYRHIVLGFVLALAISLTSFIIYLFYQKKAKKLLLQEVSFQQALINALPIPVYYTLDQEHIHGSNHAFRHLTATKNYGEKLSDIHSIYLPGQADKHKTINQEVLSSHRGTAFEGQILNSKGELQDVIFYKAAFLDKITRKYGIIETIVDISEKKKQTERIRLSEERYTLATKATRDGIWDWDLKKKELFVSDRFNEMMDYPPRENVFYHDNFNQQIHPDDLNIFNHHIDLLREEKRNQCLMEIRMKKKNGTWLWVEMNIFSLSDKNGEIYRLVGSVSDIQKRKETQQELKKWEEIFNHTLMGIGIIDPDTERMETMNPVFASIHGFHPSELKNKPISLLMGQNESFSDIAKIASEKGHHVVEIRHRRKNGSTFPVMMDVTPAKNNRGELMYFIINLQDITERKQQEDLISQMLHNEQTMNEELRSSEEEVRQSLQETVKLKDKLEENQKQFLSFINGTSDFVFLKDRDLRYLMVNEAFAEFHKHKAEEFIGKTDFEIASEALAKEERKNDEKVILQKKAIIYEREEDGLVFETRKFPVIYDRNYIGVGAFVRNTTAQRIVEKKVLENEKRFKTLLENSFDLITLTDKEGVISYCTDAIKLIAGIGNKDAIGKHFEQFIHEEDRPFFKQKLDRIIQYNNTDPVYIQHRFKHPDGTVKNIETIAINHLKNPLISSLVFTSRDVSVELQSRELRKNISIAQKSAEIKQQFLANMSHEIRTPMSGILGMIEFLMQTKLDETQWDYVSTIKSSADSLLNIINDILDFSKIEAGKLTIKPAPVDIRKFIADAPKIFAALVKQKNLEFQVMIDNSLPQYVNLDHMRLNQVISNLLSNAIKFTSEGKVTLSVFTQQISPDGITLKFEVKDTGIGISQKEQQKLFTPFTQIDSSLTRSQEGTGLGLTISQRIIELMDGEMGVISNQGEGALFWFTIPASIPEHEKIRLFTKDIETTQKQKLDLDVLLVEDKVVNQKVIRLILESLGCKITIANNGKEAIDLIEEYNRTNPGSKNVPAAQWDIIFMDIQMPVMDGITATGIIRRKYPQYPVIIGLSANVISEEVEAYLQSGLDDYIVKPAKSDDLYKKLLYWSEQKKKMKITRPEAADLILEKIKNERILEKNSLEVIKQQSENNALVLNELFNTFFRDTIEIIDKIKLAVKNNDSKAIQLLQSLQSMAASMGAIQLGKTAEALEENILYSASPGENLLLFLETAAKNYRDEALSKT